MDALAGINDIFPARETEQQRGANSVGDMGSEQFLTLMVAQLENQDPTKPMDNMQFLGQLAQFGTVSGIQEMNAGFGNLAASMNSNQALQASTLVGRQVVTEGNVGLLEQGIGADGSTILNLDATVAYSSPVSSAQLYIQDPTGRLMYSSALPANDGNPLKISWDGRDSSGNPVAPGEYRISVEGVVNGQATTVPVHTHQRVGSVSVDPSQGGVTLNLANGKELAITDVKEFL